MVSLCVLRRQGQKRSIFFRVLFRNVVLRHLARMHFGLVGIKCIFHAADCCAFKRLTFVYQFFHTLGIHDRFSRQSLRVTRSYNRF